MGIRRHVIQFEQNPDIAAVRKGLCDLTGLALIFDEEFESCLGVQHPTRPKYKVELDWVDKENRKCIRVESETPNWNYIEISTLHLLKQFGGKLEKEYAFPIWAGKKWSDAYPSNPTSKLKAWWYGKLP